jgi:protein TonB
MRVALLLATGSAALLASSARAECDPQVVMSRTHFPAAAQMRGQQGTVLLEVKVDESGRVSETQLIRSSGHERLDRIAAVSARKRWVFDVTGCERKDLPATDVVAVEFRFEAQE